MKSRLWLWFALAASTVYGPQVQGQPVKTVEAREIPRADFEKQFQVAIRSFDRWFPYGTDCQSYSRGCKYVGTPKSLDVWLMLKEGMMQGVMIGFDGVRSADPDEAVEEAQRLCAIAISVLSESKPRQSYPVLAKAFRSAKLEERWSGTISGVPVTVSMDDKYPLGTCRVGQT